MTWCETLKAVNIVRQSCSTIQIKYLCHFELFKISRMHKVHAHVHVQTVSVDFGPNIIIYVSVFIPTQIKAQIFILPSVDNMTRSHT